MLEKEEHVVLYPVFARQWQILLDDASCPVASHLVLNVVNSVVTGSRHGGSFATEKVRADHVFDHGAEAAGGVSKPPIAGAIATWGPSCT